MAQQTQVSALEFLKQALEKGPMRPTELFEAAQKAGISSRELRKAMEQSQETATPISARRVSQEGGKRGEGYWLWQLVNVAPKGMKGPFDREPNLVIVPVDLVETNPWQPRTHFDDEYINDLAASIKANGLQEYPAGRMHPDGGGRVQLVYGHQRLLAFRRLALKDHEFGEIPVIIREYTDLQMSMVALEENRARRNLTPYEETRAMKRMMDEFDIGPTELGEAIGLHKSTISKAVGVLELPQAVIESAESMGMALNTLRELSFLHKDSHTHEETMLSVLDKLQEEGSVTREALHRLLDNAFYSSYAVERLPEKFRLLKTSWDGPKFDINAFQKEYGSYVHHVPNGSPVTCAIEQYQEWQEKAEDEQNAVSQEQRRVFSITELAVQADERVEDSPEPAQELARANGFDILRELEGTNNASVRLQCGGCSLDEDDVVEAAIEVGRLSENDEQDFDLRLQAMKLHLEAGHLLGEDDMDPTSYHVDAEEYGEATYTFITAQDYAWLVAWVHVFGAARSSPEVRRLTFKEIERLLPQMVSDEFFPFAGRQRLPQDFNLDIWFRDVRKLWGLLRSASLEQIASEDQPLVEGVLGSRMKVYQLRSLSHGDYELLTKSQLDELASPEECLRGCAWGFALIATSVEGNSGIEGYDRICTNTRCFKYKKGQKARAAADAGTQARIVEDTAIHLAALALADSEGFAAMTRQQAALLCLVLGSGYTAVDYKNVYWREKLGEILGLKLGYTSDGDSRIWDALQEHDTTTLQRIAARLVLEHLRSPGVGKEWKPLLYPWLKELGLDGLVIEAEKAVAFSQGEGHEA